jgi:predicted DNA-binding protein (MmcQ/YjbR family)
MSEGLGSVRRMSAPGDVSPEILDRLRPICLGLPETYEEPAWIGIRWRVRRRTFAHVYTVEADQPVCRLTFRSPGDEIDGLVAGGHPFARADWGVDVVRMVLDDDVDWTEVGELLTESYLLLAPKRLAALVDRPPG